MRGVRATMYTNRPWTIRQYAGFSTAEESNAFYRANLAAGQMGLSVAFDLATHRGYDSDHPRVIGDVGKAGVAIDSVEDMKILFDGIPLDKMTVSMTMNGAVLPILAGYVVAAEEQGVDESQLGRDHPERHPQGVHGPQHLHLSADAEHADRGRHHRVHGRRHAEVQLDLDLRLPHAGGGRDRGAGARVHHRRRPRVRAGRARHAASTSTSSPAASRFFFAIGMNFFMEVAKLRAARLLWSRVIGQFDPQKPGSSMLRTHCQTSGVSLTEQDPYNNIVRTTVEALAAVLGGTQSLHTNSFDEAIGLPSEFAARVARNTQLILAEETGVTKVVDPLGGSYYVEALTASLANEAWKLIEEVEALGGMTKSRRVRACPSCASRRRRRASRPRIDRGDEVIVGVNKYRLTEEDHVDIRDVDNAASASNKSPGWRSVRAKRDDTRVRRRSTACATARAGDGNLLELSIEATRARATVGEISDALEEVFCRHRATIRSIAGVYGAAYEGDEGYAAGARRGGGVRGRGGPAPAPAGREAGPGRSRPRRQGDRHRLRRPRLRRRRRARSSRPRRKRRVTRSRTTCTSSACRARPRGTRRWSRSSSPSCASRGATTSSWSSGGVIPAQDYDELRDAGVAAIFGPGTNIPEAAAEIVSLLRRA